MNRTSSRSLFRTCSSMGKVTSGHHSFDCRWRGSGIWAFNSPRRRLRRGVWYHERMAKTYSKHLRNFLGLSVRHIRFCEYVATGRSATQSFLDAGFRCPATPSGGPNRASAGKRAWELLKKPEIRRQIRTFRDHATEAAGITTDLVATSLKHEALFPRRGIFHPNTGRVLPPSQWPPEVDAFVTGFDVKETTRLVRHATTNRPVIDPRTKKVEVVTIVEYKIRFTAPTEAKRILAQWLGMIGDKVSFEDKGRSTIMTVVLDPTPTDRCDTPFPTDDDPDELDELGGGLADSRALPAGGDG